MFCIAEDFEVRGAMVYDKKTKLSWEETPHKSKMEWSKAVDYCKAKKLRLPNLNELSSLLDYNQSRLAVRTNKIHFISYDWYWTSSAFRDSSDFAWFVNVYSGSNGWAKKETKGYVICVESNELLT
jgi:hypothetical protein